MDVLHVATALAFGSAELWTFDQNQSQTGKRGRFKCSPADSELSNPQSLTTKGRAKFCGLDVKKSQQKETEKTEKFNSEL
jgi:hypothetical protein